MKLSNEQKEKFKEITKDVDCPFDLECLDDGLESVPDINQIGNTDLFECKDEKANGCKLGLSFGYSHFCKCPARLRLKKELGI